MTTNNSFDSLFMRNILQYIRHTANYLCPRNSTQLFEAQNNRKRRLMEDNKSDRQIIQDLVINNHTYCTYKSRIQKEDARRIHMNSANTEQHN